MEILDLKAEKRTAVRSKAVRKLRDGGHVPAILYGHKLDNVMLSVKEDEFGPILQSRTRMVRLAIDNKKESALIKDVQYDNITDRVLHVDFSRIDLDEKVRIRVQLELVGEPIGVKDGGILTHTMKEIEIECLPTAIPEKIKVDISDLGKGKSVHVKELPVVEGIQYVSDADAVVVSVHRPAAEKAVPEEELMAEPEVITRKPKEGEEEAESGKKA
ncbi:MAG: 50S ribosomal protein L25 [Candidatus Brocadiaceae bacterium]